MTDVSHLLAIDSLRGMRVGVSVSESPDLARLGLLEEHLRLAVAEIARTVLVAGGRIAYGGHLRPEGYTAFLIHELRRYSRRDSPLIVCLAWSEHRRLSLPELRREIRDLGLLGDLVCLDVRGRPVAPDLGRGEDAAPEDNSDVIAEGLTGMRRYLAELTDARVLVGGKRKNFSGRVPGVLEEALISIQRGQPLYLAGGFGGVTLDVIRKVRAEAAEWLPTADPNEDERLRGGLEELGAAHAELGMPDNGLTSEENRRLASTHRASEIASLLSLGLGRLAAARTPTDVPPS
jgi:hypothetical protein